MGSSGDRQALADGVQGRSSQCDHPEISGWLLNPVPSILRKEETRRGHAGRRPCESGSREIGGGGAATSPGPPGTTGRWERQGFSWRVRGHTALPGP